MGARIPDLIRKRVIQQLLQGVSRDDIAGENDISDGTISTIFKGEQRRRSKF
jgi:hypothetical protein